jgi:putative Holliday junction resolvase
MKRILAIDYGLSRVGVAMSDPHRVFAFPRNVIRYKSDEQLAKDIIRLCDEEGVGTVVIGKPVNLDGEITEITQKVLDFIDKLNTMTDLNIEMLDERMTTKRAEVIMHQRGQSPSRNKDQLNSLAAAVLLEDYIDLMRSKYNSDA